MDGTTPPLFESGQVDQMVEPVAGFMRTESAIFFSFQVKGTPRPKARPRFRRTANFVQTYTPETTVNWEQTIVAQVKQQMAALSAMLPSTYLDGSFPFKGRIGADIRVNSVKPKSAPKSVVFPLKAQPGDVDNLAKSVLDALQLAGVIQDDKTVTDLTVYKRFADGEHPEGVEVDLIAWF